MSEERIALIGSNSANGIVRVKLNIEMPYALAMKILDLVQSLPPESEVDEKPIAG